MIKVGIVALKEGLDKTTVEKKKKKKKLKLSKQRETAVGRSRIFCGFF